MSLTDQVSAFLSEEWARKNTLWLPGDRDFVRGRELLPEGFHVEDPPEPEEPDWLTEE